MVTIRRGDVILFEGDSVTDCGRDRADKHSLSGYTRMIAAYLDAFYGEIGAACYNRAVSGDTSAMLLSRYEASLREVSPTVVSLLVGINDVWRRYDAGRPTSAEDFERQYRALLELTVRAGCERIVLLEPFLLPADPAKAVFVEDLAPKIAVIRRLAAEYRAAYVPLDGLFAEACVACGDAAAFAPDGVHPSERGNRFIAQQWLRRVTPE